MKTSIALGLGLTLTAASGAIAANPPATLMAGTATATTAGTDTQCATGTGPATFQRNTPSKGHVNPQALIDIAGIVLQPPAPAAPIYYYGMMVLTFKNAGSGTIAFDYNPANTKLPSGETAAFAQYSQTFNLFANTLDVKFKIALKNCTLPVELFFRAGPPL